MYYTVQTELQHMPQYLNHVFT